jgi:molybdopterin synthase sulfur carrier subunit
MDEGRNSDGRKAEGTRNRVKIEFFATLRLALGVASIEIELSSPKTIREIIKIASDKLGTDIEPKLFEGDKIRRGTMILVNGKNIHHINGLDTMIHPGDRIAVFPPAGGG